MRLILIFRVVYRGVIYGSSITGIILRSQLANLVILLPLMYNLLKEPNPFQNIRYYCYNKDLCNCIEHIILVDV